MPNTEFHEYEDSPSARAELVAFLEQTGDLPAEQGVALIRFLPKMIGKPVVRCLWATGFCVL